MFFQLNRSFFYIRIDKNSPKFGLVILNIRIGLTSSLFLQFFGIISFISIRKLFEKHHIALILEVEYKGWRNYFPKINIVFLKSPYMYQAIML